MQKTRKKFVIERLRKSLVQIRVDGAKEFLAKDVKELCKASKCAVCLTVKTEQAKFSWLVKTVNSSDKRMIMKFKEGVIEVKEMSGDKEVIKRIAGEKEPYTWAVEKIMFLQKKKFFQ